jgi:hypothetical protein
MVQFLRAACLLLLVSPLAGLAQTQTKQVDYHPVVTSLPSVKPQTDATGPEIIEPFDGTYCFVFTKGVKQAFTDEIKTVIDANRKENEEVILVLSEYCKLQILSRKQINSPGFIPFPKSFIFE